MTQEATGDAEALKPKEAIRKVKARKYDAPDVWMLFIIMAALAGMFLGGLGIIVGATSFKSADVVAILAPALAAVGTVAAGVFGYTLGTRGTTEAQQTAAVAQETATAATQESGASVRALGRIVAQAKKAGDRARYEISADDLNSLLGDAAPLARRLGVDLPEPIQPPPEPQG
jgi:hypothetical protein